jgi:hypothetical protein
VFLRKENSIGIDPPSFRAFKENDEIPSNMFDSSSPGRWQNVPGVFAKSSMTNSELEARKSPMLNTTNNFFNQQTFGGPNVGHSRQDSMILATETLLSKFSNS